MKFVSHVRWIEGKKGELTFENGEKVRFSSPPDFGGVKGLPTPEEFLVASLNACFHQTFLTFAQKMRVGIESFEMDAEGHLDTSGDKTRFVKCVLRPRIVVSSSNDVSRAGKALRMAEERCFISNSVNFEVVVSPSIQTA
ncbi:MAG: OsmC family protein [Thermoplasmata archaeon]